jgi:chemotaxis protein CheD
MNAEIRLGIGDGAVVRDPAAVLTAPGLGSCVAVMLYSETPKVGAMAHILLPTAPTEPPFSFKYADTAVAMLLKQFEKAGADPRRAAIKLAGGAQMFKVAANGPLNIGRRNLEVISAVFQELRLRITAQDVGGSVGRTVTLTMSTGRTVVRVAGGKEYEI